MRAEGLLWSLQLTQRNEGQSIAYSRIGRCVIHKEREHMNAAVFLIAYSDNTAIFGVIKYICHHFTTV